MNSARDLHNGRGFPIRTSADQRSLASPRGFSQRATSFIASWRQGIHRTPLSHSPSNHQNARTQYQTAQQAFSAQTASSTLTNYATLPFPDSPVKDRPWREQVSAEGGLLEAPRSRAQGSRPRPAGCPAARRQPCMTSREESGAG